MDHKGAHNIIRLTPEALTARLDAARQDQFERDCKALNDLLLADSAHGLSDEEQAYEQGFQAAINCLRNAWEEQHG